MKHRLTWAWERIYYYSLSTYFLARLLIKQLKIFIGFSPRGEPPDNLKRFDSESSIFSGDTESELEDVEGLEPLHDLSLTPPSRR